MSSCLYLGPKQRTEKGFTWHECRNFKTCTLEPNEIGVPSCASCLFRVNEDSETLKTDFKDPLRMLNSSGVPTDLRTMLTGSSAFIVGGGPSLLGLDLRKLRQRGVFSLGVNNAAMFARTNAFICSDPLDKFHHSLFKDPSVMKFIPRPKLKNVDLRVKQTDGSFSKSIKLLECPNVWAYEKRGWLEADHTFFTEPSASLGNFDEGVVRTGRPKSILTLFAAIRVLYYLGARTIYLLGCDFRMSHDTPYAFEQAKDIGGVNSNNERYNIINSLFHELRPVFNRFGLTVLNATDKSALTAFNFVTFDEALKAATSTYYENTSLSGWYEK